MHTRHFCTQYFDKKALMFLRHRIQCPTKVISYQNLIEGIQDLMRVYLYWSIEICCYKLSNSAMHLFIAILCAKITTVYKALKLRRTTSIPGPAEFVHFNRVFAITDFVITEFHCILLRFARNHGC